MSTSSAPSTSVRRAPLAELPTAFAYRLLQLRVDVFVVEQECAYPELDGRDLEPGALQWWVSDGGTAQPDGADPTGAAERPVATLRTLLGSDALIVGRVATAAGHRGSGLAGELVRAVLADCGPQRRVRLDAQAHLEGWYARFGFARSGPDFVEDGIPHLPMVREPVATAGEPTP